MDSLTQIVLGASVAEALGGKKLGNKAALWGAFAGTLPDLDVLTALFLDPVDYLGAHRGFSHSIFFPFIAAPVLAWLGSKLHRRSNISFSDLLPMFFFAVLTHPLLDLFTGYGTQIFNPITDYAFELNAIFIIDPVYTLPLLSLLIASLFFRPGSTWRKRLNLSGLSFSTAYLILTLAFKFTAIGVFEREFNRQGIEPVRYMTIPGPFTSIYWRALVETDDAFLQGYVSLLDPTPDIVFHRTEITRHLIDPWKDTPGMKRLEWFSKGYYHVTMRDGVPYIHDLRFGSIHGWRGDMDAHVFSFRLNVDQTPVGFTQMQEPVDITADDLTALYRTMFNH